MNPVIGPVVVRDHAADLRRLAAGGTGRARLRRRMARPVGLALVRVGRRMAGVDERDNVVPARPVLRTVRG